MLHYLINFSLSLSLSLYVSLYLLRYINIYIYIYLIPNSDIYYSSPFNLPTYSDLYATLYPLTEIVESHPPVGHHDGPDHPGQQAAGIADRQRRQVNAERSGPLSRLQHNGQTDGVADQSDQNDNGADVVADDVGQRRRRAFVGVPPQVVAFVRRRRRGQGRVVIVRGHREAF